MTAADAKIYKTQQLQIIIYIQDTTAADIKTFKTQQLQIIKYSRHDS